MKKIVVTGMFLLLVLPAGVAETRSASLAGFSCPFASVSSQRPILDTSPAIDVSPVTSTRTRRRFTLFVGVERLRRSIGTFRCPGSTVTGERFEVRTVRTSPGGFVPGGRNSIARRFGRAVV